MDSTLNWLRTHPLLAGLLFFVGVAVLLAVVLSVLMTRAGQSLRPLAWFYGFLLIVAGPQIVLHLLDARSAGRPARMVEWATVFGPEADPALITDAKRGLDAILADAQEAKISFTAAGTSALAARFGSPAAAANALRIYCQFFQFTAPTGQRYAGQGEWNHVVAAGNELYAWTGPTRDSVLAQSDRALGNAPASRSLSRNKPVMAVFMVINLILAGLWFIKGAAWAARTEPSPGRAPVTAMVLRESLLALNRLNFPAQVTPAADGQTLIVDWRYADAQWLDLMRVHKLSRAVRLTLALDEPTHRVCVRESWSRFDAAAGAGGAQMQWQGAVGIQFFAIERERVFGIQLGPDGRPTGELSQEFAFRSQDLKGPLIRAVTDAGWSWQPVFWGK